MDQILLAIRNLALKLSRTNVSFDTIKDEILSQIQDELDELDPFPPVLLESPTTNIIIVPPSPPEKS
jgi:hypothetical protein